MSCKNPFPLRSFIHFITVQQDKIRTVFERRAIQRTLVGNAHLGFLFFKLVTDEFNGNRYQRQDNDTQNDHFKIIFHKGKVPEKIAHER
ncbi:hypothetical protein SAMN05421636_104388 [Pricia antarctica]|uniref:Uncharacterized protein n=1 Tax=Pricia antarctica TaxID=641691 RepID=A0A1G7C240_9FLAO|nr:hypothetical protein SAMN05421636_104388 [Pricia antarctica]